MTRWLSLALLWLMSTTAAIAAPYPPGCIQAITFGVSINGQLTTSDCSYSFPLSPQNLYYYDIYTFSGAAGQLIAISMTSPSLDADLYLYNVNDTSGAPIAHDDDGGGGLNARIPANSGWFTLPTTGTYYISAEAIEPNALGTGPYTITVNTAASVAVDLHQHGLTGTWYEPATNGQGVLTEVFPDLIGPGTGRIQVSWFTFDASVPGGPERQRWYTMGANVATGAASVALPIYQNVGGNFNAPPITNSTQVGTATLRFADCEHGTLDYTFTDGSGRSGRIDLTRLTKNVTCVASGARPVNADFALSGNWYDPPTSGQGLTVEINPLSPVAFFAWYTYAPGGAAAGAAGQRWYTGQSGYVAGARTLAMTLYETTGGLFDAPTPVPAQVAVGTATLTFQSCTAATLDYIFTGGSNAGAAGRITLTKIAPTSPGCVM